MEDDMDIQKRTTRKELNDMSDMELDSHLIKTRSAHKLWWEGEQRIRKQYGIHLKTASADLQQQEQQRFGETKTPGEGRFGDRYAFNDTVMVKSELTDAVTSLSSKMSIPQGLIHSRQIHSTRHFCFLQDILRRALC